MWKDAIDAGGPVMYAVVGAWIIVLAGVIERVLYAVGRAVRRPVLRARDLARHGRANDALRILDEEDERAARTIDRIDGVSQLATSIGLFGTVLGIAQGFLARGASSESSLAALSEGLSTALFTTIAGLFVFLFGQVALLVYREWLDVCERAVPIELRAQVLARRGGEE